jgi:hypothetical protein
VLNVLNLLQWCFNRLIPVQSPHSDVFVNPFYGNPYQGFICISFEAPAHFQLRLQENNETHNPQRRRL